MHSETEFKQEEYLERVDKISQFIDNHNKKDIQTAEDIQLLVDTFYDHVKLNQVIGPIFTETIPVDWEHHLPKMYKFWGSILLGERSYEGNPMQRHVEISGLTAMGAEEFSEWLLIFTSTVNSLFEGEKAKEAIVRAGNISRLMLHNIEQKKT